MSVSKALLEHSHAHLFTWCPWLVLIVTAELKSDHRDLWPQCWQYLLFIFDRKCLLTRALSSSLSKGCKLHGNLDYKDIVYLKETILIIL
jgi:hypothetical protein